MYIAFLVGVVVGALIISALNSMIRTFGTLRIDHSNPDKDKYKIEIEDLSNLHKKKRVILKVDSKADLSHN